MTDPPGWTIQRGSSHAELLKLPSPPSPDEKCLIEGYALAWAFGNGPDFNGWVVKQDSFPIDGPLPPMKWDHEEAGFGEWESVTKDPHGLKVRGYLDLRTERGGLLAKAIRYGVNRCLSICLVDMVCEPLPDDAQLVKEAKLFHISLCAMASNYHGMIHRLQMPGAVPLNFRRSIHWASASL